MSSENNLPPEFKDLFYTVSSIDDGNLSFTWGEKETVLQNRKRFLLKHDIKLEDCVGMNLVHKNDFKIVRNKDKGICMSDSKYCPEVDALITKEKGLYLFLLTADCIPITIYDPNKKVLALAHASWINTNTKISSKLIDFLKSDFDCAPEDLLIYIGPCIHKKSYIKENPQQKDDKDWQPYLEKLDNENFYIDIVGYNIKQLTDNGIKRENIFQSSSDTCISEEYFSYYRSVSEKTPEGRFATVIGIKP